MPRRRMTYELDADESKALDGFRKLTAEQRRSVLEGQKGTRTARQHSKAVDGLSDSFKRVRDTILGFVGAQTVLSGVRTILADIGQALEKNRQAAEEAMDPLTRYMGLAGMSRADRDFLRKHAGMLTPTEASDVAFTGLSRGATEQERARILREADHAKMMGEAPETLRNVVAAHMASFRDRNLAQIVTTIRTMAKESPFTMQELASITPRITGIAGATEAEKVQGIALASAMGTALGAEGSPELAATAARQFMARQTSEDIQEYYAKADMTGASMVERLEHMARDFAEGRLTDADMVSWFGQRAGPSLMALFRSEAAMEGLRHQAAAGTLAMTFPRETSQLAYDVARMSRQDPEWRAKRDAQRAEVQRGWDTTWRGFRQAPLDRARSEMAGMYEAFDHPVVGELGGVKTGMAGRLFGEPATAAAPFGTPAVGVTTLYRVIGDLKDFTSRIDANREAVEDNTRALQSERAIEPQPRERTQVNMGGTLE